MLNELNVLRNNLKACEIEIEPSHPWIQPVRQGEALVAEIDSAGRLSRISRLDPGQVTDLRKVTSDDQKSFPDFKLNCPLLVFPSAVDSDDSDVLWQAVEKIDSEMTLAWKKKDTARLRHLVKFAQSEILPKLQNAPEILSSTRNLIMRLERTATRLPAFAEELASQIVTAAKSGRISNKFAVAVLLGKTNHKKRTLDAWTVTLLLDVDDPENFFARVADPAVGVALNRILLAEETHHSRPITKIVCALTGKEDAPVGKKLPKPNLPVLGPSYLMSMNAEARCQTRYRRTSTAIFPVGHTTIRSINDSIAFVREARRGTIWEGVPDAVRKNSNLLIAYLEEEPHWKAPIASVFAGAQRNSALEVATFKKRTEALFDALRLLKGPRGDKHIRLLVIGRIDKGRRKVLFNESYSVEAIFQSRERWLSGAQNIPEIAIPFPAKKGEPAGLRNPEAPTLGEVTQSFKMQWLRSGTSTQTVPGVPIGRVYGLLLDRDASENAGLLLDRYIRLTAPVLIGVGQFMHSRVALAVVARSSALMACAIYGILLYRMGFTKESYMEDREFELGQFLQMADLLHSLYCKHVRDGHMPPQLLGNAAVPMAIQNPKRALAVLADRIVVYKAWASRHDGNDSGLAHWSLNELSRLADSLRKRDLEATVTTAGKAQLLLGYLARMQKKEN